MYQHPLPPATLHQTYCQLIRKFCALSKPFITMYNSGQTSWDTKLNEIARQIEASSLSLPSPLPVQFWRYAFKF